MNNIIWTTTKHYYCVIFLYNKNNYQLILYIITGIFISVVHLDYLQVIFENSHLPTATVSYPASYCYNLNLSACFRYWYFHCSAIFSSTNFRRHCYWSSTEKALCSNLVDQSLRPIFAWVEPKYACTHNNVNKNRCIKVERVVLY